MVLGTSSGHNDSSGTSWASVTSKEIDGKLEFGLFGVGVDSVCEALNDVSRLLRLTLGKGQTASSLFACGDGLVHDDGFGLDDFGFGKRQFVAGSATAT